MMVELMVEIEQGKIKGRVLKNFENFEYCSFKGIPYAKPPIGALRFCVPQPPDPWQGIRDGTKDCNICAQLDKEDKVVKGDEDCLYLNVYTPKSFTSGESYPVMVFLHGGGFLFGNGTDDSSHGPDYLIHKKVVILSINYRLGILGFLALNMKEAPGNMGLRDQVQALKWVQRNIKRFGGDPNNVTIFGISAGAASVEYLLLSPMAKGLFHKAIAQSGSSLLHWAQESHANIRYLATRIPDILTGRVIEDNAELLQYLKGLSTNDLIIGAMASLETVKTRGGLFFGFVPTVEQPGGWEPFLDKLPYELLTKGQFNKVPYVTGFCSREGLLMTTHCNHTLQKFIHDQYFVDYFPFELEEADKIDVELRLKANYGESLRYADDYAINFFSDVDFIGGIYTAATLIAQHNAPVFMYEFSYDGAFNYIKKCFGISRPGACHGDDGGYIVKSDKLTGPSTEMDRLVRNTMTQMWVNFASYGNPTPRMEFLVTTRWESMTGTQVACLVIDEEMKMKAEIYPQRMKLFEELYRKKKQPFTIYEM